jgi:THO complex subunit 1
MFFLVFTRPLQKAAAAARNQQMVSVRSFTNFLLLNNTMQAHIFESLAQNAAEPSAVALAILESASRSSVDRSANTITKPPSGADSGILSNAVTDTVLDLAQNAAKQGEHVMDYHHGKNNESPPSLALLVDAVIWLASQTPSAVDLNLPSTCLEVAVEAATNAECDGILSYLDSRLAEFKRPGLMQKSHHTLLRTCTLLLKRLSKSQDASLCGRVLLFLAKFLPLTERSGVNLTGAFHVDNLTPVEDVAEGAVDAEGKPVDVEFYTTFWGLQRWFANPPSALAPGQWTEVSRGVRAVLQRFASEKVTVTENALLGGSGNGATSVKYLSSARLLPLQLRDAAFRRHFLLQALILMAWVEYPLLKDWAEKGAKGRVLEDLHEVRKKVLTALEATPEKGSEFATAIRGVLSGELSWATWKQANCPPEPLQVAALAPPEGAATAELGPPKKRPRPSTDAHYGIHVGTEELDRLWNLTEDNLSTLGADDRGGFKTLRQLMEPVIEEMNEEAGTGEVDNALKASKNSTYSWKTLRLVARDSLPAFAAAVRAGGDLDVAARALYPDEVPAAPAVPDPIEEEETKDAVAVSEAEKVVEEEPKDVEMKEEGEQDGDDDQNQTADEVEEEEQEEQEDDEEDEQVVVEEKQEDNDEDEEGAIASVGDDDREASEQQDPSSTSNQDGGGTIDDEEEEGERQNDDSDRENDD